MRMPTDRLAVIAEAIEKGGVVDWKQVAQLQALDIARIGRQFVEDAITDQEQADAEIAEWIGAAKGGDVSGVATE